jgi:hypothetical protein
MEILISQWILKKYNLFYFNLWIYFSILLFVEIILISNKVSKVIFQKLTLFSISADSEYILIERLFERNRNISNYWCYWHSSLWWKEQKTFIYTIKCIIILMIFFVIWVALEIMWPIVDFSLYHIIQ